MLFDSLRTLIAALPRRHHGRRTNVGALPTRRYRPRLEKLEQRTVPALVRWNLLGSGDWGNPVNWLAPDDPVQRVPQYDDIAVIDTPVNVTHSQGDDVCIRVELSHGESLTLSGGLDDVLHPVITFRQRL
jgi:hypothetical protein